MLRQTARLLTRQTSAVQHLVTCGSCPAHVLLPIDSGFSNKKSWLHLLIATAVAASGLTHGVHAEQQQEDTTEGCQADPGQERVQAAPEQPGAANSQPAAGAAGAAASTKVPGPVGNDMTAKSRLYTQRAQELYRKVLMQCQAVYKVTDGWTASCSPVNCKGEWEEAERFFRESMQLARRGFGESDPHFAATIANLAEFLRVQRRYQEAEPLYREAVARLKETYGSSHIVYATAVHCQAGNAEQTALRATTEESRQEGLAAAGRLYETALQAKRSARGNRHEDLVPTMAQLISVRRKVGQQDAVHDLLLEAASILSEQGPESLSRHAPLVVLLAGHLGDAGLVAEAEVLLQQLYAAVQAVKGPEDPQLGLAAEALSHLLGYYTERLGEARSLLLKALEVSMKRHKSTDSLIVGLQTRLGNLECRIGRKDPIGSQRAFNIAQSLAGALETSLTSTEQLLRGPRQSISSWLPFSSKPQPAEPVRGVDRARAYLQSVTLRVRLYRCTKLQAEAESQLGRTTDAEASQRKALSYVDPDADLPVQHLLVQWRKRSDPGDPLLYELLESAFRTYLTAQKDAVVTLYMTLAKQAAEGELSQDKQNALQAELADLQAKADRIAATLPKSDTWRLQHVVDELKLAQQSDLV